MLTFKQFLGQQEDNISDQDAIKKYNEYKEEFRRQQINEFFLAHKEEEWYAFSCTLALSCFSGSLCFPQFYRVDVYINVL